MNNKLWITKGSSKMRGIYSINTSSVVNMFCQQQRTNEKSICSKCYSLRFEKMRKTLEEKLLYNSVIISQRIPQEDLILEKKIKFCRFNSFGELINAEHAYNCIRLANANPDTKFSIHTKRIDLFEGFEKPKNLMIIQSSTEKGKEDKKHEIADGVFTVYDKIEYDSAKGFECQKQCISCLRCYSPGAGNIKEKVK